MTEDQYNKAYVLKSKISGLRGLIEFVSSPNVRFSLGQEEEDGEIIVPIESIYHLDKDILEKYLNLCQEARIELVTLLNEKLEDLEREFDYV